MSKSLLLISFLMIGISSTLYSVQPDFTVVSGKTGSELAHAYYDMRKNSEGWNYLKIYANSYRSLLDQHRGVGFLEGYLTYNDISYAYKNMEASVLKGSEPRPKLADYMNEQIDYIDRMTEAHSNDLYWQYAKAKMEQVRFMYRGFLTRLHVENRLDLYITSIQFFCLTFEGDLQDLIPFYQTESPKDKSDQEEEQLESSSQNLQSESGNCNLIAKLIEGQLYIGHSTHNIYEFMIRTFKTYHFPTTNKRVGSETLTFSSRPGDLISKDDFYVLDSGLVVMETSLANMDPNNANDLSSQTVPTWMRQTIACHLANNISEWTDYFLRDRSGTHNNQWVVIDKANLQSKKNVVTYVEEGFSLYDVIDITELLFEQGYVASYNVPYGKLIYDKLAYQKCTLSNDNNTLDPYTFENDPRAHAYKEINQKLQNEEDMKKWLIYNNGSDVKVGLAPRYDLAQQGKRPFGLTDCKVVSPGTLKENYIWAISGPTTSNGTLPAFEWKNFGSHSHLGMPETFDFSWVKVNIHHPGEIQKQTVLSDM